MKCDEIFAALAMLEKERGIPQSFMMGKIIQALTTAYKRDHEGVEYVVVDVDEEKKDLKMYVQKEIVEEVENPASQISLEEAKHISAKNELGGMVNFPVESVEFGRIAAGNGKQVIIQGLREAEHGMIYDEWGSKQHEILTGTVSRIDPRNGNVILRIGSGSEATEAVLTMNEQVPGEELHEGQMVKVYLVEVRRSTRGPQVMISRTHPGLVKRLFEMEVPEIFNRCPVCGRLVCDRCFLICEDLDMCTACAGTLEVHGDIVAGSAASSQPPSAEAAGADFPEEDDATS